MPYETTKVSISDSQGDIRGLLWKHGADEFAFREAWLSSQQVAMAEFVHRQHLIRIHVPLKDMGEAARAYSRKPNVRKSLIDIFREMQDQEGRRMWRVLYWTIKAKLEAVEEGLVEFDQEFFSYIVDPQTDLTVYERLKPSLEGGVLDIDSSGRLLPAGAR